MWQIVFWLFTGLIALLLLVACALVIPLLIISTMKKGKAKDRVERKKKEIADARTSGPDTEAVKASRLSDRLNAAKRWIDAGRKYSLLIPVNIVWGWWVGVIIFRLLGGSENQIWLFLWEKHFWMTFLTPFIVMAPYFLIKSKILIQVAIGILITCILGGFWIAAIEKEFFVGSWTDNARLTTSYQKNQTPPKPVYKTISEFVVTQDEWTAPYQTPPDYISGGGFYTGISGPVHIRTTYLGKVTEMDRKPGDEEGVGKAETLEFRAIGNNPVRVKIMIKVPG